MLQLVRVSQIKSKTVMNWSSEKKEESIFCSIYFVRTKFFMTFVFFLNVQCIEKTFGIFILSHVKKHYFIHFCCLVLKSSKAFSVSLSLKLKFILHSKNMMFFGYFRTNSLEFCFEMFRNHSKAAKTISKKQEEGLLISNYPKEPCYSQLII